MIASQKKKNRVGAIAFRYTVRLTKFGTIGLSFRADGREQTDQHAESQAAIFGPSAAAHFKKAI